MYEQIASNKRRTLLIIFFFVILVVFIGFVFGSVTRFGYGGIILAAIIAIAMSFGSYYYSDKIVLTMSRAYPASREEYPYLNNVVEGLAIAGGIPKPKIYVIDDPAPNAFATGRDPQHSTVAVTTGLVQKMNREELEGVVAHELSHIKNYDIRLMTLTVVMVGVVALLSDWLLRSFFWGGRRRDNEGGYIGLILLVLGLILAIVSPIIAQLIRLALSRQREYLADASGAMLTRYPPGLAHALEKIAADKEPLEVANKATASLYIATPPNLRSRKGWSFWNTHPPIEERIKRLEEMSFEKMPA